MAGTRSSDWLGKLFDTGDYTQIVMGITERQIHGWKSPGQAAIEACVGIWARAFASFEVSVSSSRSPQYIKRSISPSMLYMIGSDLLLRGESAWLIEEGGKYISPASSYNIHGDVNPETWVYTLQLNGPTGNRSESHSGADVLHFRINSSALQPWTGRSPLTIGAKVVSYALEQYLESEVTSCNEQMFIRPESQELVRKDDHIAKMHRQLGTGGDLRALTKGDPPEYARIKFGPEFNQASVNLRNDLERSIVAAAGIPPGLVLGQGGGTATREDLRRLYAVTIQPISLILQEEFNRKMPVAGVVIDSSKQAREADAASKARSSQSRAQAAATLVGIGVDIERALRMVELEDPADD